MPGKKSEALKAADIEAKALLQKNIVLLRKKYGLTQEALADALGINRGTYCNYENRSLPPQHLIIKLAQIYNISPDCFYRNDLDAALLKVNTDSDFFEDECFCELTQSEQSLLMKFRQLKKSEKKQVATLITDLSNKEKK
ncbi:MAG: helix-turn-helix transcriptional regulator [Eubacterium sp.]|nr:helix-turn-helix transcriptional regulator [Eubacterium sp.]